jgi:hypothetical protein
VTGVLNPNAKAFIEPIVQQLVHIMENEDDKECCARAIEALQGAMHPFGRVVINQYVGEIVPSIKMLLMEKGNCQPADCVFEDEGERQEEQDHDEVLIDQVGNAAFCCI